MQCHTHRKCHLTGGRQKDELACFLHFLQDINKVLREKTFPD